MTKIIFIFLLSVVFFSCENLKLKSYNIEVYYCDSRPMLKATIKARIKPTNSDISTFKQAAPIFYVNGIKHINVCNIVAIED